MYRKTSITAGFEPGTKNNANNNAAPKVLIGDTSELITGVWKPNDCVILSTS